MDIFLRTLSQVRIKNIYLWTFFSRPYSFSDLSEQTRSTMSGFIKEAVQNSKRRHFSGIDCVFREYLH